MSLPTSRFARLALGVVATTLFVGGTATAAQASTGDAPSTYSAVKVTSAQSKWLSGALPKTSDVDTYRFTTKKTAYARVLLGDLHADYRLRLLDRSGHRLSTSDRSGLGNEEIYRKLSAGTYYVAVDAPHKRVSSHGYVVKFSSLNEGLILLSQHAHGSGTARQVDFEVLNNTSSPIEGVEWNFTPAPACDPVVQGYCSGGSGIDRLISARGRATISATDAPATNSYALVVSPASNYYFSPQMSVTVTSTTKTTAGLTIKGSFTNSGTHEACYPAPVRRSYDARGGLLASYEVTLPWDGGPWLPHHTYAWTATHVPATPAGTARTNWGVTTGPPPPTGGIC